MRCAACSCASHTIVMREVSACSLSPTVSETMLMFKRRNSDATRVNTPGLSCTSATNVCSILLPRFLAWIPDRHHAYMRRYHRRLVRLRVVQLIERVSCIQMVRRHAWMVEVLLRAVLHAQLLHHAPRS